jgi:hypothetical protein
VELTLVKCDEAKPYCLRCQRTGRSCAYSDGDGEIEIEVESGGKALVPRKQQPNLSAMSPIGIDLLSAKNGTPSMHVMQHFLEYHQEVLRTPNVEAVIQLSRSNALVRSTILAMSASHLRHQCPAVPQHRVAEFFHLSLALQEYRKTLTISPQELGQAGVNTLLLSGFMLNLLAFTRPEPHAVAETQDSDPSSSWVFSWRDDRLGWLALQAGLRQLLKSLDTYLPGCLDFLGPIFFGNKGTETAWGLKRGVGLEQVPELWVKMLNLDSVDNSGECGTATFGKKSASSQLTQSTQSDADEAYLLPALVLVQLSPLKPVPENVFKNFFYLGKMGPEFRALLFKRDARALWLFGYWLGIMCRYEGLWWFEDRVRRDYTVICNWLEEVPVSQINRHWNDENGAAMWKKMLDELRLVPYSVATCTEGSSCSTVADYL